jgi:hypothetical protein
MEVVYITVEWIGHITVKWIGRWKWGRVIIKNIYYNDIMNNNDIDLFINTYEKELNNGIVPHPKIGLWIQYLKALKFYNVNNIDKDPFFDKRHSITKNDINEINNFMVRIKKGKQLYKNDNYNISGNGYGGGGGGRGSSGSNPFINYNYVDGDEGDDDGSTSNKNFELLSQVEGALHEYNEKMRKNKNKNSAMNMSKNRTETMSRNGSNGFRAVDGGRVDKAMNNCHDNYKFGVQDFANGPVTNANKLNAINQIDATNKLINYNYTNNFDNEFKRSIPNIANNKRHQEHNSQYNLVNDNLVNYNLVNDNLVNDNLVNDNLVNDNLVNYNLVNDNTISGMVGSAMGVGSRAMASNGVGGIGCNGVGDMGGNDISERYQQDALYTNNYRFNQDQDILKVNLITRETSQKNKQPFENQFQYLDCNYNRIPNKSLIGESSRMDNRTYIH